MSRQPTVSFLAGLAIPTAPPLPPEAAPVDLDRVHTRLIQRLCAAEPHTGYTRAAQMGPLSSVELAAVLASDPEVLAGAGASEALNTTLSNILSESAYSSIEQSALLGAALLGVLHPHARKAVLYAVQGELTRDAENQRADAADERAGAQTSAAVRRAQV